MTTLADLIAKDTCSARLAKFLIDRREQWIDGRLLATVGGAYAWRTRLSELRKAPWYLDVENRVRTVADGGRTFRVSEYRLRVAA
jgi:hypothetical protein